MTRAYLDYNATSPLHPEAQAAMRAAGAVYGNPSSIHKEGQAGRALLEEARLAIAQVFQAPAESLIFTSGGTEACNLALQASLANGCERLIVSDIEHPAVRDAAQSLAQAHGLALERIPVNTQGQIQLDAVADLLKDPRPALIAVMAVNNETGVVQPVAQLAELARAHGSLLFSDAVQAAGKLPLALETHGDLLAISAHKFGGPKGIGAVILRPGLRLPAKQIGGGQERYRRAGTPNVVDAAGCAAALVAAEKARPAMMARFTKWQAAMEKWLRHAHEDIHIVGGKVPRVPCCSCIAAPGLSAEALVIALDLAGYAVSAGAACSSGKIAPSHVLKAQGLAPELVAGAIRISWGWRSRKSELLGVARAWSATRRRMGLAA